MAQQNTPHTQTQQNTPSTQTDLDAQQLEQEVGRGDDAEAYNNREGAQSGGIKSSRQAPPTSETRNVEPQSVAYEGSITSRLSPGAGQGISNHSTEEENARQEKVVSNREDTNAGVNHSDRARKAS